MVDNLSLGAELIPSVDYQLGNGKRSSLAVPQHLPALVDKFTDAPSEKKESILSSGTVCPIQRS